MSERAERALRLHGQGYNCAQAVVCAYCDQFGMDEQTAYRMAEGFGFGMGLMEVCGALSAAFMLAGLRRIINYPTCQAIFGNYFIFWSTKFDKHML